MKNKIHKGVPQGNILGTFTHESIVFPGTIRQYWVYVPNQYMLWSVEWAGYKVNHTWGEDTHGYRYAGAIMPDILRWLWKIYTKRMGVTDSYDMNLTS